MMKLLIVICTHVVRVVIVQFNRHYWKQTVTAQNTKVPDWKSEVQGWPYSYASQKTPCRACFSSWNTKPFSNSECGTWDSCSVIKPLPGSGQNIPVKRQMTNFTHHRGCLGRLLDLTTRAPFSVPCKPWIRQLMAKFARKNIGHTANFEFQKKNK